MKCKQLLALGMSALMLTSLLCACQATAEDTERQNEEQSKTSATEREEKSWEEIFTGLLPSLDTSEDPDWQAKILLSEEGTSVLDGEIHKNGKYAVVLNMKGVSQQIREEVIKERLRFDGYEMSPGQSAVQCGKEYQKRFTELYVEDSEDILSASFATNSLILYASEQEIRKYAKSNEVLSIESADKWLETTKNPVVNFHVEISLDPIDKILEELNQHK